MSRTFLFYISGHGYGHARRMTQVIRETLRLAPGARVVVRTRANARIFSPLPEVSIEPSDIDAGVVEKDAFTIDRGASLNRVLTFLDRRRQVVADELQAVARIKPTVIVADIPFLAGDVAAASGVPCVGISNFTWDWIYDHLFGDEPRYPAVREQVIQSYAKFSRLLELPFGKTCSAIPNKTPTPLIALCSRRKRGDILKQIGIAPNDSRPRVLIGTRGSMAAGVLDKAATQASEYLFLCPHETEGAVPGNGLSVSLGPDLDFSDLLRVSDVVISKLGYGMISECICAHIPLVWPPREGFAEDEVVSREAPACVPMVRMEMEDYVEGNWKGYLDRARQIPKHVKSMSLDGSRFSAKMIAAIIHQ